MNLNTWTEAEVAATGGKLRLFALYVDFAAAVRARWAASQISRLAGGQWKTSSEMWNLDSLAASESIRKMILQDAADADVLIVAMSSLDRRELELVRWLDSLAAVKASRPVSGLCLGLLGDEAGRAKELDWTVKQFLHSSGALDRDFIWHWMDREAMQSVDWLTESVGALLTRKQPAHEPTFWPETVLGAA